MIRTPDDAAYNRVRALMRAEATYRHAPVSKRLQHPAGASGPVARYVPGTPEYEALVKGRAAS